MAAVPFAAVVFAAAVVAPTGIALGVLVREYRADRFEHGIGDEVLARDQLDREALTAALTTDELRNVRIRLIQMGGGGLGHFRTLESFLSERFVVPRKSRAAGPRLAMRRGV